MLFVSLPPPLSRALLLAGYFTLSWAQLALPTWRKANITTSAAARTAFARAALQETIVHIGANGQFPDAADYVVPAIFYSQLAAFDAATGSQQYRDSLVQYFQNATMIHANFSNSDVSPPILLHDTLNYGYAAVQAYVTYKDPVFLEYAIGVWNISNQYTLSQADIDAGRQKSGLKNFDLAQTCHGKTMAGGTFGITAVSDPSIDALPTGHFAILSALLASSTSEPRYLAAAQLSTAFMLSHWLNPQNVMLDYMSGRSNDSCSTDASLQPYDSGMAIEALAILIDITHDPAYQRSLNTLIEAATTSTVWQGANGVIANRAHSNTGDLFLVRGLSAAYSRNVTTPPLKEYIKAYLAVQYNAVLDLARSSGPDNNNYGLWIGPAATSFASFVQTAALGVLVAGIGLHNETQAEPPSCPVILSTAMTGGGGGSTPSLASPTSISSTTTASAPHHGSRIGAVAGVTVAAIFVVALLCAGCMFWIRRRQWQRQQRNSDALSVSPSIDAPPTSMTTISPFTSPVSQTSFNGLPTTPVTVSRHWKPPSQSMSDRSRTDDTSISIAAPVQPVPRPALASDDHVRTMQSRPQTMFYDNEAPPMYPGTGL
ncbi:Glycoside hydrolase family 76 protein [Mycena indigotica]|uniref:Glycoside hydrolase family 76 protein n=1 Tax=Mycena indigotica TaxID=2126181 RepID=A0A8H6TET8_9AGAR|nr:Glycoside hydrolase family 76 protein [Mycena indigotica]KAF7316056.1 Glycoside hydrolase family 76 protein [Mycena indigotica]